MDSSSVKTTPPDVNVGARRPGSLPEAHEAVFDLKAGEISPVYSDPAALYIYKVVSIRQVPLSEVKTQISQTVQRQMYSDKLEEIQKAVTPELNDAYFGPETRRQRCRSPSFVPACRRVPVRPGASLPAEALRRLQPTPPAPDSGSSPH